jgi:hypothetical protein
LPPHDHTLRTSALYQERPWSVWLPRSTRWRSLAPRGEEHRNRDPLGADGRAYQGHRAQVLVAAMLMVVDAD